jgi:hypothetical protein
MTETFSYPTIDPPVSSDQHYFTLGEAQALDYGSSVPTDDQITAMRDTVEELFEHQTGVAFIPRTDTFTQNGMVRWPFRLRRVLVREVLNVTLNGTLLSSEQLGHLSIDGRWLVVPDYPNYYYTGLWGGFPWFTNLSSAGITVSYTHGYDQPPARIKQAALILLRTWLVEKPVDKRATQIAAGGATINLATPGIMGSTTGVPEVDEAISEYSYKTYI